MSTEKIRCFLTHRGWQLRCVCYNKHMLNKNALEEHYMHTREVTLAEMINSLHYALDLDRYKLAMCSTEELLELYNKYCA